MKKTTDYIPYQNLSSLHHLFLTRVERTPKSIAYTQYNDEKSSWENYTWYETSLLVAKWANKMKQEGLTKGDRIAIMLPNCIEWIICDQAAFNLGLVVVPLYINDRAENTGYIIKETQVKLIVFKTDEQWMIINEAMMHLASVTRFISIESVTNTEDERYTKLDEWISNSSDNLPEPVDTDKNSLATIVFTSGTTGRPKGVMLSHNNILWNTHACSATEDFCPDDIFLSFLPLSHMFERTVGYYMPIMCGSNVAYARSIEQLGEDLQSIKPTILVTVPRIFERVYNKIQLGLNKKSKFANFLFNQSVNIGWQRFLISQKKSRKSLAQIFWPILNLLVAGKIMAKLGGNMRLAICGGAPLSLDIAKTFIGLGLTLSQGYGMTEASPVVCTNELDDNEPDSVGQTLIDVEVALGEKDELLIRSPGIMMGYWNNEKATQNAIDDDNWLHTGDKAKIINRHIYITGRLKEILVLSNGEKVPPPDIELAISSDPLIEQVILIGEGKPFLSAILVLNPILWKNVLTEHQINLSPEESLKDPNAINMVLKIIENKLINFPGYTDIYRIILTLEPWTVEAGLITPTLKLKRSNIIKLYSNDIEELYKGH
ncbi:Long-chain-fatty-acid--CoA ligase [hydrothermal vent metagenome]|uniref:Long-chain-fatty-acid--CoA ligase n=1 Tax=hydrothermal vent metagenome TaxID=652676 RepID=A0A3B0ZGM4_9ZZZZ